jgi:hypothetical protein
MSDQPVTLEFIAEQNVRILAEIRAIRDTVTHLMLRRIETKMDRLLDDARLDRIERRLDLTEDAT